MSSKTTLEGLVSLVVIEGYFRLSVASIQPKAKDNMSSLWDVYNHDRNKTVLNAG
jgi:hypothetical protein